MPCMAAIFGSESPIVIQVVYIKFMAVSTCAYNIVPCRCAIYSRWSNAIAWQYMRRLPTRVVITGLRKIHPSTLHHPDLERAQYMAEVSQFPLADRRSYIGDVAVYQ